jgi:hypothetical protein
MVEGNTCNCFHPTWKSTSRTMVTKVLRIASWIVVHLLPRAQCKRWIPIGWMGCVHMHQKWLIIKRYSNPSHVRNTMEKTRENKRNVMNIITNHGFPKGSTRPNGCLVWIKILAMNDTWFFGWFFILK